MTDEFVVSSPIGNLTDGMVVGASELRFAASSVTGGLLATLAGGADRRFQRSRSECNGLRGTGNDSIIGGGEMTRSAATKATTTFAAAGGDTIDSGAGNDTLLGNGGRDHWWRCR